MTDATIIRAHHGASGGKGGSKKCARRLKGAVAEIIERSIFRRSAMRSASSLRKPL